MSCYRAAGRIVTARAIGRAVVLAAVLFRVLTGACASAQSKNTPTPIVNGYGLLLGASRGSQWLPWEKMHGTIKGGETYRLYSLMGPAGEAKGGRPALSEASGSAYVVKLAGRTADEKISLIGVACRWQPMPRRPVKLSPVQKIYLTAVADVLKQHGLRRATPHIEKIVRVDLTGRGQDAILIEAASRGYSVDQDAAAPARRKDAYSFVLLRTVSSGTVKTYVLSGEFGHAGKDAPSERYNLAAVLDLNGDGVLEIVVETSYYEGGGNEIYDVKSGRPRRVLKVVDGA